MDGSFKEPGSNLRTFPSDFLRGAFIIRQKIDLNLSDILAYDMILCKLKF